MFGLTVNTVSASYCDSWGVLHLPSLNKCVSLTPGYEEQCNCGWKHPDAYFPDEPGNKRLGIWGHHTSHGAAFAGLEYLVNGDIISLECYRDNKVYNYMVYSTFIIHDQASRVVDDRYKYFHINCDIRSHKAISEGSINFNYPDHELYLASCYASAGSDAMIVKGLHPC
ncbi:MAG: sortase [Methanobrevibacter sp.]|nr:sortase [Methanobrevibacter sp.]